MSPAVPEAILLTFSNLINLLLIDDHRHTVFVKWDKWIKFIPYHFLSTSGSDRKNKNYMHDMIVVWIKRESQLMGRCLIVNSHRLLFVITHDSVLSDFFFLDLTLRYLFTVNENNVSNGIYSDDGELFLLFKILALDKIITNFLGEKLLWWWMEIARAVAWEGKQNFINTFKLNQLNL